MLTLSRIFALSIVALLFGISSVSAFSVLDLSQNPNVATRYDALRASYETRYQTLYPLKEAEMRSIEKIEWKIEQTFIRRSTATSRSIQRIRDREIISLSRQLDRVVRRLETTRSLAPRTPIESPTLPLGRSINEWATWINSTPVNILYYADQFEGGKTANGNVFNHAGYSAARCDIELGTLIQVRSDDISVVVKANDRPNCAKHPDIVDLTRTAFTSLAPLTRGKLSGSFIPLDKVSSSTVKKPLDTAFFKEFGIELEANIPNLYLQNETLILKGSVDARYLESLVYLVAPSGKKISYGQDNITGNTFTYHLPLSEVGVYDLVIAGGRSFSGARGMQIEVLSPDIVSKKQYFGVTRMPDTVALRTQRREAGDLTPTHLVSVDGLWKNTYREVTIQYGSTSITRSSMGDVVFSLEELTSISSGTRAEVIVRIRQSSTNYSLDTYSPLTEIYRATLSLVPLYKSTKEEPVSFITSGNQTTITLNSQVRGTIEGDIEVITPSGRVDVIRFAPQSLNTSGVVSEPLLARATYTLSDPGVYLVEINYTSGFAAAIEPITYGAAFSILPNVYDTTPRGMIISESQAVSRILDAINTIRLEQGLSPVKLDPTLTRLAQYKADDMNTNNYVGHTDSLGESISASARRLGLKLTGRLGENVAGGTVSPLYLQSGLSLSSGHRSNMLGPWSKVGIAVVIVWGKTSVVQVFGE